MLCIICVCVFWANTSWGIQVNANDLKASELVEEIRVGWNLGNTLDCHGKLSVYGKSAEYYETLWGNPKTTQEMIQKVKEAGFNAIRIPVTYMNHIDEVGTVDKKWLARVEEIVQYGLSEDMYVIINLHHDTGYGVNKFVQANLSNIEMYKNYVEAIWGQIASYFKGYDNRLLFESMNETLDMTAPNPWYGNENSWEAMNQLNQAFVSVVRATGGNNVNRNLIVNTYGAQTTYGPVKHFKMPEDSVSNHLIVGVHSFVPNQKEIKNFMWEMFDKFVKNGYPVLVTEFGTDYKRDINQRTASAIHFINYGHMYGIKCFWWDDGGDFKLLNRKTNEWKYPLIVDGMMLAVEEAED